MLILLFEISLFSDSLRRAILRVVTVAEHRFSLLEYLTDLIPLYLEYSIKYEHDLFMYNHVFSAYMGLQTLTF